MIRPAATLQESPIAVAQAVDQLRALALRSLERMYLPEQRRFAFRLRRENDRDVLEGVSPRYTAIVLLGLREESPADVERILAGGSLAEVADALLADVERFTDFGEVALTLWAARRLGRPAAQRALDRLVELNPVHGAHPTVELSWALTALSVPGSDVEARLLARQLADRLRISFVETTGLFPHWPLDSEAGGWRAHVACFADLVYPTQALSFYYRATGDPTALRTATQCAKQMCALQGPQGQWWWHFDTRTGRVLEPFPVYAVHQDAMGPMALLDLQDAGGPAHRTALQRSLDWLHWSPELAGSLIDTDADVIWRKVGRHEPGKLTRSLQATLSRVHPQLRVPAVDTLFRPGRVDFETRPYHMGWLLYAWTPARAGALRAGASWQEAST